MVIFSARVVTHVLGHCWRSKSLCVTGLCLFLLSTLAFCQPQQETQSSTTANQTEPTADPQIAELSEEERQQVKVAERFMTLLEKNPRRGTALDRVYSHHVEFGTIDKLLESLKQRTQTSAEDSAAWMLLGLFETNRGQFESAVTALVQAEKLRATDPLASYYLGLAQAAAGDSASAAATLERAIERKPQRVDLQEFYQQLGRIHLRAQRLDEALAVWQRLEQLFPEDVRVLEEIATAMIQEERYEPAKPRYEKLLTLVQDDYRRTTYQLALADIAIQLGGKSSGIHKLEQLLSALKPESWLFREVRRRIDDTFLKAKDQDGLVKYYETWLSSHAEDLDGMSRLSRYLSSVARSDEARRWAEKAVALAPSRVDLRKSLIQLLIEAQDFEQAGQQYSQLVQLDPANVDHYRDWGKLVMRDTKLPMAERHKKALAIWQRMIEKSPNDALLVSQVADLCRQAENLESAEVYYRKAVELAPNEVQYREYLGEFLHQQKRPEEALAVWEAIIAGDRRTAYNLARVAEIYKNFKFEEQAVAAIAEAAKLEPKDFALQIKAAKLHQAAEQSKQALVYLSSAESLASNDDERELVIAEKVQVLKISGELTEIANRLELELREAASPTGQQWYLLARYWEGVRQWVSAENALQKVIELEPRSIQARTLAARLAEGKGNTAEAAEKYRELANVDRRLKAEHWMKVCALELASENSEAAYQAAKQVVQSAPNNPSYYEFFAQTCLKVGKVDEGIQAFRKAIRIDPGEWSLLLSLAKSLAEQGKIAEAIDLYHRAFDKSDELDDKLEIIPKLTRLYNDEKRIDQLLQRLEVDRKDPENLRAMTICIAQVYRTLGQNDKARAELESLYQPATSDTILLNQLSKLCQETNDIIAAIKYQRQLVAAAPGPETESPLAQMLVQAGELIEAGEIFKAHILKESDPARQLAGIDSLLSTGRFEIVKGIAQQLLFNNPEDWELIYRLGLASHAMDETEEAQSQFKRFLDLNVHPHSLSRREEERRKQNPNEALTTLENSWDSIMEAVSAVQQALYLNFDLVKNQRGGTHGYFLTPSSFMQARIASIALLRQTTGDKQVVSSAIDGIVTRANSKVASVEDLYDGLYLNLLDGDVVNSLQFGRRLATIGGEAEKLVFFNNLFQKDGFDKGSPSRPITSSSLNTLTRKINDQLDPADLDLALKFYIQASPDLRASSLGTSVGRNFVYQGTGSSSFRIVGYSLFEFLYRVMKQSDSQVRTHSLVHAALVDPSPELILRIVSVLAQDRQSQEAREILKRWPVAFERLHIENPTKAAVSSSTSVQLLHEIVANARNREDAELIEDVAKQALPPLALSSKGQNLWSKFAQYKAAGSGQIIVVNSDNAGSETPQPLILRDDYWLLLIAHQSLAALNRQQSLEDYVAGQAKEQKAEFDTVPWKIYFANIQYWKKQNKEAFDTLEPLVAMFPEDNSLMLAQYEVALKAEKFTDALVLAQKLVVKDVGDVAARDNLILQVAVRLGDRELGVATAKKLISQSLPLPQQLELIPVLMQLKMTEEAAKIQEDLKRSQGRSSVAYSMGRQLGLQQLQIPQTLRITRGQSVQAFRPANIAPRNTAPPDMLAVQALQVLDKTKCLFDTTEISDYLVYKALVRTSVLNSDPQASDKNRASTENRESYQLPHQRQSALGSLQRLGELEKRINTLEARVQGPDASLADRALLVEALLYAGNDRAAMQELREMVTLQPESRAVRFLLAGLLCERKQAEGFELYLALLREHTSWMLATKCHLVPRIYWGNAQRTELVKILMGIAPNELAASPFVRLIVQELLREADHIDLGIELIEHWAKGHRSDPQSFLRHFVERDSWLWRKDRFFEVVEWLMLPDERTIQANPWHGSTAFVLPRPANQSVKASQAPTINNPIRRGNTVVYPVPSSGPSTGTGANLAFYDRFMDSVVRASRQDRWGEALNAHLAKNPGWLGGWAFRFGHESFLKGKSISPEAAEKLFHDRFSYDTVPQSVWGWIYRKLTKGEPSFSLELKLIDIGITRKFSVVRESEFLDRITIPNLTPAQTSQVRQLLHKQLSSFPESEFHSVDVAERLSQLGYQLDAIEILSALQSQRSRTRLGPDEATDEPSESEPDDSHIVVESLTIAGEAAVSVEPSVNEARIEAEMRKSIEKSRENFDPEMVTEQLFMVRDSELSGRRLLTFLPRTQELFTTKIFSPAVDQFVSTGLSKNGNILIRNMTELRQKYPADLRLAELEALWGIRSGKYTAKELLPSVRVVRQSIPTSETETQAHPIDSTVYWLVAAALLQSPELLSDPELQIIAEEMAEYALAAASQKATIAEEVAILAEWGSLSLSHNQRSAAEEKWRRLLDTVGSSNPAGLRGVNDQSPISPDSMPLSLSQFHDVIALSEQARKAAFVSLHSDALMMAFGTKVPQSKVEVAEVLRGMLTGQERQPIEENMFRALKLMVFPTAKADQIEIHGRVISRYNAEIRDLATILIDSGKDLGELDWIEREIDKRSGDKIGQLSLRIILWLAQDRQKDVPALLEQLTNELKTSNLASQQQTLPAAIAALRALQTESLKEPATRLLVKLGYKAK